MTTKTEIEIQAVLAPLVKMFESYLAGDLPAMMNCYTSDLVVLPQVGDPIHGREAWQKFVAPKGFDPSNHQAESADYHIQEVNVLGDWAWVTYAEWKAVTDTSTGERWFNYIKSAQMHQKQDDGEWKIARYIWNKIRMDGTPGEHKAAVLEKIAQSRAR